MRDSWPALGDTFAGVVLCGLGRSQGRSSPGILRTGEVGWGVPNVSGKDAFTSLRGQRLPRGLWRERLGPARSRQRVLFTNRGVDL